MFAGPGLVLDPISLAFSLEGLIPFPASKPSGAFSLPGFFDEVALLIGMEVVVFVLPLLLFLCHCLALILQDPIKRRSAGLERVFGPC